MLQTFETETKQDLDILKTYVAPINLLVNLKDIETGKRNIRLFVYSIGKERIIMYGSYNTLSDSLDIESEHVCHYSPPFKISAFYDTFSKDYKYVANIVINYIARNELLGGADFPKESEYIEYKELYYTLMKKKKRTQKDKLVLEEIIPKIKRYETYTNLHSDAIKSFPPGYQPILHDILNAFVKYFFNTGKNYNRLSLTDRSCPQRSDCIENDLTSENDMCDMYF